MAKPVSSFRTPGTVWPCHTSIGLVVLRGASEVSICQRWRYHAARSATRELSASRSVVTRVIWRVRKPGVPIWSRTSRSTHAAGRAANASRASHEGPVCGVTQVTRGVWTPRAVRQRARGRPLTAGHPLDTRHDQGPTRREIHHDIWLTGATAPAEARPPHKGQVG
jgi:hypothetical protein